MREFLWRRDSKSKAAPPVFSPLFLYYKEREVDGSTGEDAGSYGRTSVQVMNETGVCLESTDPYKISDFTIPPTLAQLTEAKKYRAGAYHRLSGVDDMKSCLASKYVFVVGFTVYDSFERPGWTVMPIPKKNEPVLGGHEVLFIGYSDEKQSFKVRNSWGADWKDAGNFWFPFEAAANPDILQDCWLQHLGAPWK
jgi:C1A family cysteine protease